MEMERTRRSIDRSRELAVKKPRLAEDAERERTAAAIPARDRERPAPRGGGASSADPRFRGGERQREQREDSARGGGGGYQPQPQPQLQQQQMQELVAEYKTALAELTFNSKPIITNLTIIAGENIQAAKGIAATICAHILEVPSDQKLPSLYLLDSIVKNIGRDYIKYFAARLPEVFCKAYRQVDPSIHSGMKHLYGTWKGVFHPAPLQVIEKELFANAVNNASSKTASPSAPQPQRSSHSIHVNPKYLEARQRLQQSSHPKVMTNDSRDSSLNSGDDLDRPNQASSTGNARPWADPSTVMQNIQYPPQEMSESSHKSSSLADRNLDYGTDIPQYPESKIGRTNKTETTIDRSGHEGSLYGTNRAGFETSAEKRNGFDFPHAKYKEAKSSQILSQQLPTNQTSVLRSSQVSSKSWKNSEEEEYLWDDLSSKFADHSEKNDTWKSERNFEDLQKPANVGRGKWAEPYWNKRDSSQIEKVSGEKRFPSTMEFNEKQSLTRKQSDGHLIAPGESYPDSLYAEESISRSRNPSASTPFSHTSVFSRISIQPESHQPPFSSGLSASLKSSHSSDGLVSSSLGVPSSLNTLQPNSSFQHMKTLLPPLDHQHLQLASQSNQTQMPISGQPDRALSSKFTSEIFPVRQSSLLQFPQQNLQVPLPQKSQIGETSLPYAPSIDSQKRLPAQHQSHYDQLLPQKEAKPLLSSELGRPFSLGVPAQPGGSIAPSNSSETAGTSTAADLLAAIMKSRLVSSSTAGDPHIPLPRPPLPGGPPPPVQSVLPSIPNLQPSEDSAPCSSTNNSLSLELNHMLKVNPPLPPGPPPHSSVIAQLASSVDTNLNPLSSLLSSLVAKGIITSQGSQAQTKDAAESNSGMQLLNRLAFNSSNFSGGDSDNFASVVDTLPIASSTNELPVTEEVVLAKEHPEHLKDLIGFEFKPEVIRSFHTSVINSLFDDLKHQCRNCGLRFMHQDKLDEHLHSHDKTRKGASQSSNKWFPNLADFISGSVSRHSDVLVDACVPEASTSELGISEPMVPADEKQCICALCGERFEDVYCFDEDMWMYKGTVYITPGGEKQRGRHKDRDAALDLIVHVKCMPERSKDVL